MFLSSYHPVSWCMMVVWNAPSRQVESQAVIHQDHHQKAGQLVFHECTRETGTCLSSPKVPHFLFFSLTAQKKKHPTRPAYLPAIAHVFWRFFISFEVFRQMENAGVTLSSDWWAAFTLGPGIFGRWFSLPKKWGSLPFGVETNHQFTYPKTKVDFMYFWP